ncbi:MAG: UpxY family transcription antiterminator [Paludibacteraceae bacterium]
MSDSVSRYWLAAYVKMHHERKTRDHLNEMGIENFLPVQEEIRQWSDRRKKVERVLIPMMIFVKVDAAEQRRVIELPAIFRYLVLRGEHQPAVIPEYQMNSFRFMVDLSEGPVNMQNELLVPGEKVRVVKGPLQGLEGELIMMDGKSRLAVRIEQLGYATVELPGNYVQKVD